MKIADRTQGRKGLWTILALLVAVIFVWVMNLPGVGEKLYTIIHYGPLVAICTLLGLLACFKKQSIAYLILGSLIVVAVYAVLLAVPTMLLWNWLMPAICGFKTITFWQALGLAYLCKLLTSNSSGSSGDSSKTETIQTGRNETYIPEDLRVTDRLPEAWRAFFR